MNARTSGLRIERALGDSKYTDQRLGYIFPNAIWTVSLPQLIIISKNEIHNKTTFTYQIVRSFYNVN